jgi:hypothetical protein
VWSLSDGGEPRLNCRSVSFEQGLKAHRACAIGRGPDDLAADAAVW